MNRYFVYKLTNLASPNRHGHKYELEYYEQNSVSKEMDLVTFSCPNLTEVLDKLNSLIDEGKV